MLANIWKLRISSYLGDKIGLEFLIVLKLIKKNTFLLTSVIIVVYFLNPCLDSDIYNSDFDPDDNILYKSLSI